MSFAEIVNCLLYAFSGICFGSFASRYSVLAAVHCQKRYREDGIACLFDCLPQLLFIAAAFFLFPTWFTSKTPVGGFFYYAVLLFFFNKGLRLHRQKDEG